MKKDDFLLWGLIGLLLLGGGAAVYTMTRGLRNNNPGNIRRDGTTWQGLDPNQTDPDYFKFVNSTWGIRALGKVLTTYMTTHGLNTVTGIINRWAPPSENDTGSYIVDVARDLGVDPNQTLSAADLPMLTAAIIKHENGINPYSDETIDGALALV